MKFQKNGVVYEVRDSAHIDCFRSKGWDEIQETPKRKSANRIDVTDNQNKKTEK